MLWFGNKKRIGKLELQVEALIRVDVERNIAKTFAKWDGDRCSKCDSCQIESGSKEIPVMLNDLKVSSLTRKIHITAQEAIEKIMDHLDIEFDHVEEKPSETIIKTKEATEPCQNEEK